MNTARAVDLARRQQALLGRSAELRRRIAADAALLRTPLAIADRLRDGLRWLRLHPEVPIAAVLAIAVLRPRRAWRWSLRLWWTWRLWKRLRRRLLPLVAGR